MSNRFHVVALWTAISFGTLVCVTLRYEALQLAMTPESGFSFELLGWLFFTGLILGLTLHGITACTTNLSQRASRTLTMVFLALAALYVMGWGFFEMTGLGLTGERLLVGVTLIYSGLSTLLLVYFTKDPILSRWWSYIVSLIFLGAGIWYILRYLGV